MDKKFLRYIAIAGIVNLSMFVFTISVARAWDCLCCKEKQYYCWKDATDQEGCTEACEPYDSAVCPSEFQLAFGARADSKCELR